MKYIQYLTCIKGLVAPDGISIIAIRRDIVKCMHTDEKGNITIKVVNGYSKESEFVITPIQLVEHFELVSCG